ncbi:MAG: S9 family peptidase [Alphaproteobacteria bacterium]|nr:S9 family peptidase [Alphaproteobacteria bacterium]
MEKVLPYGAWESPLTPELLTRGAVSLGGPVVDGADVYWTELRPWEAGRTALVKAGPDGRPVDLTPEPFNVRSRVHEYGGAAFTAYGGTAWFVDGGDNRLYKVRQGEAAQPVTLSSSRAFADFRYDPLQDRLIAVCEDHGGPGEPENSLVAITPNGRVTTLASGADFYAAPRLSPDGTKLAWIEWRHPNMPWDGTTLMVASVGEDGALSAPRAVAGGDRESVFQPSWGPDGALYFISDRSGYWNLYRAGAPERHYAVEAEFGLPLWQFGMATYALLGPDRAVCCHAVDGDWRLALMDLDAGTLTPVDGRWVSFNGIVAAGEKVLFIGGPPDAPEELVELDPTTGAHRVLRKSSDIAFEPDGVSVSRTIKFPTEDGHVAYANLYLPANALYEAPEGEKPPLIVKSHGGPTGQAGRGLSLKVQYWTSRGFAVADVNYSGSTGYGRAYRDRLKGAWGVADVADCVSAARWLAEQGLVDPDRMAISGGSAGGYTTLCALTFHDVFKAGCSAYGIGDLEALTRDTHKFESRYLDRLVGPWPEKADLYRERSPIHHTDQLNCPVIFLQGADDKVVPPNQAEAMVQALKEKGLPVSYLLFEGEGHGFRRAENVKRALEAELSFYGQVFGFHPAGRIAPVEIING